ncbi:MAG: Spy/CpxP family protein refolding chaperone [Candidatus Lindowbacteria bacterium]|nr:Spy/CpxP family protein refolding chaperone [Candidatus Lindowbacteria bacterium]
MHKKKNWIIGLAIGLGLTLMASGAFAAKGGGDFQKHSDKIIKKITKRLDLNESQQEKLKALSTKLVEARKSAKEDKSSKKEQIKNIILADRLDEGAIRDLLNQRQKKQEETLAAVFPELSAFHASLDAKQKEKAAKLIEKFSGKHGKRSKGMRPKKTKKNGEDTSY